MPGNRIRAAGDPATAETAEEVVRVVVELVGLVRMHRKDFDGGQEAWAASDGFYDRVRARSRPVEQGAGSP